MRRHLVTYVLYIFLTTGMTGAFGNETTPRPRYQFSVRQLMCAVIIVAVVAKPVQYLFDEHLYHRLVDAHYGRLSRLAGDTGHDDLRGLHPEEVSSRLRAKAYVTVRSAHFGLGRKIHQFAAKHRELEPLAKEIPEYDSEFFAYLGHRYRFMGIG